MKLARVPVQGPSQGISTRRHDSLGPVFRDWLLHLLEWMNLIYMIQRVKLCIRYRSFLFFFFFLFFFVLFCLIDFFETESHKVAQIGLTLAIVFPNVGLTSVCHHTQLIHYFLLLVKICTCIAMQTVAHRSSTVPENSWKIVLSN
jgi:hypothetical protein